MLGLEFLLAGWATLPALDGLDLDIEGSPVGVFYECAEAEGERIDIYACKITDSETHLSKARTRPFCQLVFELIKNRRGYRQFMHWLLREAEDGYKVDSAF